MENLAGNADCDRYITRELERARIPWVVVDRVNYEVPYAVIGKLGEFAFKRAWYYYIVSGRVPLEAAKEMYYEDPVGRTDIRVNGHCGCPAPEEQAEYYNSDMVKLLDREQETEAKEAVASKSEFMRECGQRLLDENLFVDNPALVGKGFIDLYHIDSELGLRIFVDTIRKYNLDK